VLFDVPAQGGVPALILALGKDGNAYLLDRSNLGGIGGALAVKNVSNHEIRTAPTAYLRTMAPSSLFGDGGPIAPVSCRKSGRRAGLMSGSGSE
jgi:hypothetical protein